MTEDEAKTKVCPLSIKGDHVGSAPNERGVIIAHCLASACMLWRVRHQWLDNAQQEPDWVSYAPYAFEPGPGQERDDGFCGLADPAQ